MPTRPTRVVWVPPGIEHVALSRAAVTFRILYLRPDAVPAAALDTCTAVPVSPLQHES